MSDSEEVGTEVNSLSERVIGACIDVHRHLGPGLLESAYEECLPHESGIRGMEFERQEPLPVEYKGTRLDCAYRLDIAVERTIILESKSLDSLARVHEAQLITYLRLTGYPPRRLINFNVPTLVSGIRRRANTFKPPSASLR